MKKLVVMLWAMSFITVLASPARANCPEMTVQDGYAIPEGLYPQPYELAEFEASARCTMEFSENPEIIRLNSMITGNGALADVATRLPEEPLVVVPYNNIGQYGGQFNALSNATESGTSDFLSVRHVNLFRYSDDLQTLVPNVAKSWSWNDDFTQLIVYLRKGHKWSDGTPFTASDIVFWYNNLMMDSNINPEPKDYALAGGLPMTVEAPSETTVRFTLAAPKPGLLETFSFTYVQPYQPRHFFASFHPALDPHADANAQALGYENGYDFIKAYYGNSDWMDTPSPMLNAGDRLAQLPAHTAPTLESHILVEETNEGRHYVANPYFFQVDTTGNMLPYISELAESYVPDSEVQLLKLINGKVDYKSQGLSLASASALIENRDKGDYIIDIKPSISSPTITFNVTSENLERREIFNEVRFRTAMSLAIDRNHLNEVTSFGLGVPIQYIGFSPRPNYIDKEWSSHAASFDPKQANQLLDEIGLVDQDGDGVRDLPSGKPFVLDWLFATQEFSGQFVELVARDWGNVGVRVRAREVSLDKFRALQSANKLDVLLWSKGQPANSVLGDSEIWLPPFDGYFDVRTGMLWAEYINSEGANGVQPPAWVGELKKQLDDFQSSRPNSEAFIAAARNMVEIMTGQLLFIGTVNAPALIYRSKKMRNFPEFKTQSYEFYRTYPYRPAQWWIAQ